MRGVLARSVASSSGPAGEPQEATNTIRPRLADATLSIAGRMFKPRQVYDSWRYEHSTVDSIRFDAGNVIALAAQTLKPAWKAIVREGEES